jgi:hypothetical protein
VAVVQEAAAEVPANEAGPTGDADMHGSSDVSERMRIRKAQTFLLDHGAKTRNNHDNGLKRL